MNHLLARLALLLDGAWDTGFARLGEVRWLFAAGGMVLLIAGVVAAGGLALVCYGRTTEGLTRRTKAALIACRFVALVSLLVMVAAATVSVAVGQPVQPALMVIVDDSESMRVGEEAQSRLHRAEQALEGGLLRRLQRDYRVTMLNTSDASCDREGRLPTTQDLARCLVRATATSGDRPLEYVVLISDGIQTGPEPLANAAREVAAPLSTLVVEEASTRDVILESAYVPPFVYAQDRALVAARLRSVGLSGETQLRLFQVRGSGQKEIATTRVTFPDGGGEIVGRVELRTGEGGHHRYLLRAEPISGELTDRNNEIHFHLDVRPERIRVLFVEGEPGWEYRYAKQALERDPAVEFHGLVRLPDEEWFYQGPEKRPDQKPVLANPKNGFPLPPDELNYFDVLVVGDLERKVFERANGFAVVEAYVRERGGGLLTIGGLKVYGAGDYEGTLLAGLVPFVVQREKKKHLVNRFNVSLTGEGLMHPVMQLEYDPPGNRKAWQELPWVEGGNAMSRVKPGATRLLVHPKLGTKYGPRPVAAAWQAGRGRVLSSALDGTWHWRLGRQTEEDYHARFWGLAVRWLAGDPRRRVGAAALLADDPVTEAGKPAVFSLYLSDPEGEPMLDAEVEFSVEGPQDGALLSRALPDPAAPLRYALYYTPQFPGKHKVKAVAVLPDGTRSEHDLAVYAQPSRSELLRVLPDADALAALAHASGGKHARLAEHASLSLPRPPRSHRSHTVIVDLWQSPGLLGLLVVCLSLEWFLRKRRGLS